MQSKDYSKEDKSENEKMKNYIMELEVSLGNIEKVAIAFLVAGYANYIYAANLDILDAQDKNNTGDTPEEVFLFSQKLVLIGYVIIWIVASKRVYAKGLSNIYEEEKNDLVAYQNVADSYLMSIFANSLRLQAFDILNNEVEQSKKDD